MTQEEFLRTFIQRQKEIGRKERNNAHTLARANIRGILMAGLNSPITVEKMEEAIKELQKEQVDGEKI